MIFTPGQDDQRVAAYAGLPHGRVWSTVVENHGPLSRFDGYRAIFWGILTPWEWQLDGPPQQWPSWCFTDAEGIDHTYQIWLAQAFKIGDPIGVEQRWHPEIGLHESIVGLESVPVPSPRQVTDALRGLDLLHIIDRARKQERAHRSRRFDLEQAIRIARALLNGTPPQHPTIELIAEAISQEDGRYLSESGLNGRWQGHKRYGEDSITLAQVLDLASGD